MSGFTKTVAFETEFEGDHITMTLARLKRKTMLALSKYMPDTQDGAAVGALDSMQLLDVAANELTEYVTEFRGLKDSDGNALTFAEVADEMYFLELVSDIVAKLFEISNMGAKDAKNSPGQLSTSTGQPAIGVATSSQG